jgi:hypothetical protein
MIALLVAGAVVLCAGALAIVFGIPIKEFSFGNTMILCGTVVSSAGLILIGLGLHAREMRQLSRRLGAGSMRDEEEVAEIMVAEVPPPAPVMPEEPRPAPRAPGNSDFLFSRDEPPAPLPEQEFDFPPPSRAPLPPLPEPPAPERPKRDFLFSSRRRKAAAPDKAPDADVPSPAEDTLFERPWAQPDSPPPENDFAAEPRHPLRPQRRFTPPPPPRREEPPRREQPEVSVVKSGVVDSMAYSLYSDGSIEAQLPEGMVRFESIDELREHLNRGG